jgi:hypothetical protein
MKNGRVWNGCLKYGKIIEVNGGLNGKILNKKYACNAST